MPEFTLRNYLEIEATAGPEEDQEDDEEEFGKSVLIFGMPLGLIVYTVETFSSMKTQMPTRRRSMALRDAYSKSHAYRLHTRGGGDTCTLR